MKRHERCRIGGSFGAVEIPLLTLFVYLFNEAELGLTALVGRQYQMGSLAGAGTIYQMITQVS